MDNKQYRKIRKQNNFLFAYYNSKGGLIRKEKVFLEMFHQWCSLILGVPPQIKEVLIKKELDKKHNYNE